MLTKFLFSQVVKKKIRMITAAPELAKMIHPELKRTSGKTSTPLVFLSIVNASLSDCLAS